MTGLAHPEVAYRRLKAALNAAYGATPQGSAEGVATLTRVDARTLRKYADHSHPMFAPVDVVADVEALAADPIVTRVLADLAGYVLVKKNANADASALSALKEGTEAMAALAALFAKDTGTPGAWALGDAKTVLREVRDALPVLAALERALAARVEA